MNRVSPWLTCAAILLTLLAGLEQSRASSVVPISFDSGEVRDTNSLEIKVIQDWQVVDGFEGARQKLIEITVCEWWPGQKVRLPVTLYAPSSPTPCENLIVSNMGLTLKPSLPKGAMLELLTRHHVGLVLVGTGTIDAMAPVELLQQGMREKLLETKNTRFTPAWLWGMSDMRALTAAAAETSVFRPKKVLATGGSKRGVAAALAGIHDDRFTAILPVVAPILYPPGGAYVRDSDLVDEARQNTLFLENLSPGPNPLGLPATARDALQTRETTRAKQSLSVEMAREAGWSQSDMLAMNQAAWQGCLIAHHLAAVRERGLEFFYHVGTNDNVCPGLRQLGKFHPDFPIYILPGGQHGGPSTTGFTLQTPTQPEADENLLAFARHHFFSDRSLPVCPPHRLRLNEQRSILVVKTQFPKTAVPQSATLAWCANRHAPYTIAAEYDQWQSQALDLQADGSGRGTIKLPSQIQAIDVVVTYESHENGIPFHFSSPYLQWER